MSNKKMLVVEDDADVRLGYRVLLRAHGYDRSSLPIRWRQSARRKQQPDLILLDLGLPAGDGFVVLERFQNDTNLSVILVIVVSARDPHQNKERALKAGASAYLQKPWNDANCWQRSGRCWARLYRSGRTPEANVPVAPALNVSRHASAR